MVLSFSRQRLKWWSSMFHGSWFFVLDTLSPTVVGALSVQLTQLNSPFLPSAVFRGLPRCWRVCQHRYHFFIFSHLILSTSYSTARSLPVKELSTLTSGGRKIGTVADSLPRIRKTGLLPGRSRRTISMGYSQSPPGTVSTSSIRYSKCYAKILS